MVVGLEHGLAEVIVLEHVTSRPPVGHGDAAPWDPPHDRVPDSAAQKADFAKIRFGGPELVKCDTLTIFR